MKIINNSAKMVKMVKELGLPRGSKVWEDDGSVGVQFNGSKKVSLNILRKLINQFGGFPEVGDGIQEGSFWFQNEKENMFGELGDFELQLD